MTKAKTKAKDSEDQFANEFIDPSQVETEVKVSDDEGVTWQRRKIKMALGLDESGLSPGEIFQFNGEKYKVTQGEYGMIAVKVEKEQALKKR
ncbi:hypothetical protein [Desulfosporosinus sp. SB140]|uniref:hypothetical protein n=1 Tax=Desulfosporosinus paludis TaxID=3115649 RepID=UPI0038904B19